MSEHKRTIIHHHKLETSTKLILAAIAVALAVQAFSPMLSVQTALAERLSGSLSVSHSGSVICYGCGN